MKAAICLALLLTNMPVIASELQPSERAKATAVASARIVSGHRVTIADLGKTPKGADQTIVQHRRVITPAGNAFPMAEFF